MLIPFSPLFAKGGSAHHLQLHDIIIA